MVKKEIVKNAKSSVNHPSHYLKDGAKIECIEALAEVARGKDPFIAYCCCNAVKYLWRAGDKASGTLTKEQKTVEDLEKAIWYLSYAVENLRTVE